MQCWFKILQLLNSPDKEKDTLVSLQADGVKVHCIIELYIVIYKLEIKEVHHDFSFAQEHANLPVATIQTECTQREFA